MKILITAAPKTGKSTVLKNLIDQYAAPKSGFLVMRMQDRNHNNQGFLVQTLDGRTEILSHKKLINSDILVGNGHKVDIEVVENFIAVEIEKALEQSDLFIFDEIGRMEAYSGKFLESCRKLMDSEVNFLGTILFDDEPWTLEFKTHPNVLLIEVTEINRDYLPRILQAIFENVKSFEALSKSQQTFVISELLKFLKENKLIQAKKLFDNAVVYVSGKLVEKIKDEDDIEEYAIKGKTNDHRTYFNRNSDLYTCDCDLFNGRAQFEGQAGECSHIETIKILKH